MVDPERSGIKLNRLFASAQIGVARGLGHGAKPVGIRAPHHEDAMYQPKTGAYARQRTESMAKFA